MQIAELVPSNPGLLDKIESFLNDHWSFQNNIVNSRMEFKAVEDSEYKLLTDYDLNSLSRALAAHSIKCSLIKLRTILYSDFVLSYNPLTQYLEGLPTWDGERDYIDELASTIKTSDDISFRKYFKKWFVAMVASMSNDQIINHTMLVLIGKQGIGKTTWTNNLVPRMLKEYYFSGIIDPGNKDTLLFLAECFLINLDELESLNRTQLSATKELITKPSIKLRKPYGYNSESYPHRASFIGSVNRSDFLTDTTGNRRFLCHEVLSIDYNQAVDMDSVYGQALALANTDFVYWLTPEDNTEISYRNESYRMMSIEEETLLTYFEPCEEGPDAMSLTNTQILEDLSGYIKLPINQAAKKRLGEALHRNQFLQTKKNSRQVYILRKKGMQLASCLDQPSESMQSAA